MTQSSETPDSSQLAVDYRQRGWTVTTVVSTTNTITGEGTEPESSCVPDLPGAEFASWTNPASENELDDWDGRDTRMTDDSKARNRGDWEEQ